MHNSTKPTLQKPVLKKPDVVLSTTPKNKSTNSTNNSQYHSNKHPTNYLTKPPPTTRYGRLPIPSLKRKADCMIYPHRNNSTNTIYQPDFGHCAKKSNINNLDNINNPNITNLDNINNPNINNNLDIKNSNINRLDILKNKPHIINSQVNSEIINLEEATDGVTAVSAIRKLPIPRLRSPFRKKICANTNNNNNNNSSNNLNVAAFSQNIRNLRNLEIAKVRNLEAVAKVRNVEVANVRGADGTPPSRFSFSCSRSISISSSNSSSTSSESGSDNESDVEMHSVSLDSSSTSG